VIPKLDVTGSIPVVPSITSLFLNRAGLLSLVLTRNNPEKSRAFTGFPQDEVGPKTAAKALIIRKPYWVRSAKKKPRSQ